MARPFYVITEADIGQPTIRAFGRVWWVSGFIGRILHGDVGKRVYLQPWDDVQVENDEQRAARLAETVEVLPGCWVTGGGVMTFGDEDG